LSLALEGCQPTGRAIPKITCFPGRQFRKFARHSRWPTCERGANRSPTTGVHARVMFRRLILLVCGAFVPAATRAYPRVPPQNLNGKEGVDGSSPSEGFILTKYLQISEYRCLN